MKINFRAANLTVDKKNYSFGEGTYIPLVQDMAIEQNLESDDSYGLLYQNVGKEKITLTNQEKGNKNVILQASEGLFVVRDVNLEEYSLELNPGEYLWNSKSAVKAVNLRQGMKLEFEFDL
ncbi:MAG: hypothetical protein FWE36_01010 [Erysipelotrichales bacterium]|nr:hypothetical protein [Erysipelotrichales bacterium]